MPSVFAAQTVYQIRGVDSELALNIQSRLKSGGDSGKEENFLAEQVAEALYPYGYFSPKIKINQTEILIDKGPITTIESIKIVLSGEGSNNLAILTAVENFPLQKNQPFQSVLYEKSKQDLLQVSENEGFLHASFDKAEVLINKDKARASILLVLNTSQRFYFGGLHFNQTKLKPALLATFVPFKEGEVYSNARLLAFNKALASSGYFAEVNVFPQISQASVVPLEVNLQPVLQNSWASGIGYGTDTQFRGRLDYHRIPVNAYGHQLNLSLLGSLKENRFKMDYLIPGANPLVDNYSFLSSFSTLNYASGYANSFLVSAAQRHTLPHFQRQISLNGLMERFNYQDQPGQDVHALFPKLTLTWLVRKEGLFSPSGLHLTLSTLAASKRLLSSESFSQLSLDVKAARTFDAIRTRLYFHGLAAHTEVADIYQFPLSLALLLGGAENMKAYSLNAIGPSKSLLYSGFEIQKETWNKWYLTGFFDKALVSNPGFSQSYTDIGLGLMWVSPVGPIKLGLAQSLDDHNHWNKNGWRLVINMGPDL